MWTAVLVITIYNSVWCMPGHMQRFMQHFFSISESCKPLAVRLLRDVRHAHVRWLCWQIYRTFQACNTLWQSGSRVAKFIRNVSNIFIYHLAQNFRPATQGTRYNLTKYPTAKSLTNILQQCRSRPRHSSAKCGWRHENNFIVMVNVH